MTESDKAEMQNVCGHLRLLRKNVPHTMWPGVDAVLAQLSAAMAQPEQPAHHDIQKQLSDLHQYEEIAEHYAKCAISPEALRDWVVTTQAEQASSISQTAKSEPQAGLSLTREPQAGLSLTREPQTALDLRCAEYELAEQPDQPVPRGTDLQVLKEPDLTALAIERAADVKDLVFKVI